MDEAKVALTRRRPPKALAPKERRVTRQNRPVHTTTPDLPGHVTFVPIIAADGVVLPHPFVTSRLACFIPPDEGVAQERLHFMRTKKGVDDPRGLPQNDCRGLFAGR